MRAKSTLPLLMCIAVDKVRDFLADEIRALRVLVNIMVSLMVFGLVIAVSVIYLTKKPAHVLPCRVSQPNYRVTSTRTGL